MLTVTNTMHRILATVNINMGLQHDNPSLTITRTTNVPLLIANFIESQSLPNSAYKVIMEAIQNQLIKKNISLESLGVESPQSAGIHTRKSKRKRDDKQNIALIGGKQKKQFISWDHLKAKKDSAINKIEFQRKGASPILSQREIPVKQTAKATKITLLRSKSPMLKRDKSGNDKVSRSPILLNNRTPKKQRQMGQYQRTNNNQKCIQSEILSDVFDTLTRNQPKSIRVLSPQFISFTGIKPEALTILQHFFQEVEQPELANMDKMYFIARMRQLNMAKKIALVLAI